MMPRLAAHAEILTPDPQSFNPSALLANGG